jgi:spore germination protein YaaH
VKKSFVLLYSVVLFFSVCSGTQVNLAEQIKQEDTDTINEIEDEISLLNPEEPIPVSVFEEIWAYVLTERETALTGKLPLSDIGYFGAEIDTYGKLFGVPNRRNITFPGKVHLIVACNSRSLTHFILVPGSQERRALIDDLLAAVKNYDGLQIDFENVPPRDGNVFLSFLSELRAKLGNKVFTIALPARTRKLADDVYDYEKIKPLVDKILVMAYDEHWSGSKPGSVASLQWCKQVAEYSLRIIGREKLIMGLPFYGRAWGDHNPSRALIFSTTERLIKENKVSVIRRENGVPTFNYDINIPVKVYYEDEYSTSARMQIYKSLNVSSIGFWRLGQETKEIWKYIELVK